MGNTPNAFCIPLPGFHPARLAALAALPAATSVRCWVTSACRRSRREPGATVRLEIPLCKTRILTALNAVFDALQAAGAWLDPLPRALQGLVHLVPYRCKTLPASSRLD